jgi:hypothetical protein
MKSDMMQILVDAKGKLIAAALPTSPDTQGGVKTQIVPIKGQRVQEVPVPPDLLRSDLQEFDRFFEEFHLPRGKTELVRRPSKGGVKKRGGRNPRRKRD